MRVNSAINAVRGLVALERPLIELLAEIVPATQGALILATEPDEIPAVERERASGDARQLCVSRPVIERVLRELVGVLADAGDGGVPGRTGPSALQIAAGRSAGRIRGGAGCDLSRVRFARPAVRRRAPRAC